MTKYNLFPLAPSCFRVKNDEYLWRSFCSNDSKRRSEALQGQWTMRRVNESDFADEKIEVVKVFFVTLGEVDDLSPGEVT